MTSARRPIVASFGTKATDTHLTRETLEWDDIVKRFSTAVQADIDHNEFMAMPKRDRQALKTRDPVVVPGAFKGDRRGNKDIGDTLEYRSALTFDFDENASDLYAALTRGDVVLPFDYICHPTRSHTPGAPRLRLVVPQGRNVSPAEYPALVTVIAQSFFATATLDPGSLEHARLMYMPVQNKGAEFKVFYSPPGSGYMNPDCFLPDAEPDVLKQVATRRALTVVDDDFRALEMKHPDPRYTLERVKDELLSQLDPNAAEWDRARWLKLGMILHHQGDGDAEWCELWDTWSANDERVNDDGVLMYQPGLCEKEWESFGSRRGAVTIGTLIRWVQDLGMAENAPQSAEQPESDAAQNPSGTRYQLRSAAELADAPPMKWLVRGVLPQEGLAAAFGPSGSGKSFLVLSLAAAVAGGEPSWFGRRVVQCPVTYCALEGEAGMGKRLKSWQVHHKAPVPDCLRFITQPFDLLARGKDVAELARAIQSAGGAGGLVILDTLNRAAPGADENSSVDMGNIIAAAKQLQDLVGGLVLLVHHTGKDSTKGLRGHSSLHAALDGAIEVSSTDSRREWRVAKSKDDETGIGETFRLEVVSLGNDEHGESITSCVVLPDESVHAVKRVKLPAGGNQKIALDTLAEPLRNSFEFGEDGAPEGSPCIRLDHALALVADRMVCEHSRHKMQRAKDALRGLVARGLCGMKGDWVWRL